MKPLMSFFSSAVISSSRSGCSFSSASFDRSSSACSRSSSLVRPFFRSFSTRSSRFSTCVRSLTIRSNSTLFDVAQRIDRPHMRNRVVLKRAQHVNQRIHVAQVGQERSLLQRLLPDRRHVHVFHRREGGLLRRVERRELVQPLVGHARHADVRLARIRAPRSSSFGLGQNFEQRSLAHLRQADNASLHSRSMCRAPARCNCALSGPFR